MLRGITLFSILFFFVLNGTAQVVETIEFEGATKTDTDYLRKLIDSKTGEPIDSVALAEDLQALKNLNLFFSVDHALVKNANGNYDLVFKIDEAVYLYPILSISGFQDQLKVQAGANQINFLGRAQSLGFQYQYYDRHSLALFYTAPRHANRKTGHEAAVAKYSTVEPLYFSDTVSSFNFDNYSVSLGGFYWLGRKLRLGLGGMYMWEKYEQIDDADIGLGVKEFAFNKYQIRFRSDYMGINQHFEFMDGVSFSFYSETIQTEDVPDASFFKSTTELKYFKQIGKKGNLGFRNRLGISTNNFSPFAPFVLDGFINVRGIGNRVARGTGELILNAEYRYTLLKKKYFIAQIAGFADYGALRDAGQDWTTLFNGNTNVFLGGGIRLHSRFIYKTIFRVDYSVNPTNTSERGFTFGLGQFF